MGMGEPHGPRKSMKGRKRDNNNALDMEKESEHSGRCAAQQELLGSLPSKRKMVFEVFEVIRVLKLENRRNQR
jgi:hypothetical protein